MGGTVRLVPYCPWDGHQFEEGDICCCICGSERSHLNYPGLKGLMELDANPKHNTKWRKILYERQPYPDNYTDRTFLVGLRRNANIKTYDYWSLVYASSAIIQQISIVTLFAVVFIYTYLNTLSVESVVSLELLVLVAGYGVRAYSEFTVHGPLSPSKISFIMLESMVTMILLLGVLLGLSPVLATLTNSFSNDTIYALSIMLMLIHIVSHDYGYILGTSDNFQAPVSLNAAIFASVLLGSRLSSTAHVFQLMFLAILLFALFPIMRHHLKRKSYDAHLWLSVIMFVACTVMLLPISNILAISFIATNVFISFGAPFWLIWIQKYKNEIKGPWDEAVPSSNGFFHAAE